MTPNVNSSPETGCLKRARRAAVRLLWLVCACLDMAAPAMAQEAVPPPGDPVGTYLDAIEGAEAAGGAYALELVDLYHGMGQSLLRQGEYQQARDAFYRAAMIARVNAGPHSLEQANYLYSIADVESRIGNAGAAVEVLEDLYQLHARQHGDDSADMLPVAREIYVWYRDRLGWEGVPVRPSDYQNLSYLAARIAALTETRFGLGDVRTAMALRTLGQSHFQTIRHVLVTGRAPDPELVMDPSDSGGFHASQQLLVANVMQGEEALQRVVESWRLNPEGSDLEVAEALAQVGDWNLALDFHRSAEASYREAYRVLAESPEFGFMADDYFGEPSPLRLMNDTAPYVRPLESPAPGASLEVSMSVTREGRLGDLAMLGAPEEVSEEQRGEILARLQNILFRPAVVDGEVREVTGFRWRTPVRVMTAEADAVP